jgi:SAM-dependent methyltransferase
MNGTQEARVDGGIATDPELLELYGEVPPALEEELVATVRLLAGTVPAPRHDPCYGLDRGSGASLGALERLTRHGDFRKYVFVLDAGAGLGGAARWLVSRYGCRVLALDISAARLAISRRLSARTALRSRMAEVGARFETVPLDDGRCTQVWSVEVLHHARDRHRAIAELFRVLRPGCTLALQEIVRRTASVPVIGGAWRHGTEDEYVDALRAAGFTHLARDDVTRERSETSPIVLSARETLARRLADRLPADASWHRSQAALAQVEAIIAGGDYRAIQLFATRPSTS